MKPGAKVVDESGAEIPVTPEFVEDIVRRAADQGKIDAPIDSVRALVVREGPETNMSDDTPSDRISEYIQAASETTVKAMDAHTQRLIKQIARQRIAETVAEMYSKKFREELEALLNREDWPAEPVP